MTVITGLCFLLITFCLYVLYAEVYSLKKQIKKLDVPEYRCSQCADQLKCPAAHSGVCYPCEHFKNLYDEMEEEQ